MKPKSEMSSFTYLKLELLESKKLVVEVSEIWNWKLLLNMKETNKGKMTHEDVFG